MERRVPLQRSGPLKPGKPPQRSAPLSSGRLSSLQGIPRRVSLPRVNPVPEGADGVSQPRVPTQRKVPARVVTPEERAAKKVVQVRSGGMCEMGCGMPGQDWSHRRSAAQGGQWRPANGLKACRRCHHACEVTAPLLADLGGWRIVHRDPDPAAAPVYLQAWGTRAAGWYFLTAGEDIEPAPWAPAPLWFPWMPRPRTLPGPPCADLA